MLFGEYIPFRTIYVTVFIRIIKQPQFIFRFQYPAAGCVQCSHPHFTFFDGFHQRAYETFADHIHVHSGIQSESTYSL